MLFSESSDLKLMQLVKDNPVLYDNNQPNYMDFDARAVVWQKIGDELIGPAKDCKTRWLHLRDACRRILKLENKRGRHKPYRYENYMAFIRPFYKNTYFKDEPFDEENYECDYGNETQCSEELKKKRKARKRKREFVDVQEFEAMSTVNSTCEFDKTDTTDAFLLSIGATLKTFSPYHLNVAKTKIFSIVQEHDLQQIVHQEDGVQEARC